MGTIKTDYITGITGTENSGPITLSGDTATLGTGATIGSGVTGTLGSGVTIGSGVTFPTGFPLQVIYKAGTFDSGASANDVEAFQISASITPKSGNKVMIMCSAGGQVDTAGGKIKFRLKRGTTEIFITAGIWISTAANSFLVPINYMDPTPSGDGSTSITYSIYGFMSNSTGSYYANYDDSSTEVVSSMTLMEIVG